MAEPYRVVLSRRAAADLQQLPPNQRGRLTLKLASLAARERGPGLVQVWAWFHLAACEVFPARGVILVYAILNLRELDAELVGPELTEEFRERDGARFMHGRR